MRFFTYRIDRPYALPVAPQYCYCNSGKVYASCSISPPGTRMSASMTSDCKRLCSGLDPTRERAERKDIDTRRQKSMTVVNEVQGHCAP